MKKLLPASVLILLTFLTQAQTNTTGMQQRMFQLGEVVVSGSSILDSANSLSIDREFISNPGFSDPTTTTK